MELVSNTALEMPKRLKAGSINMNRVHAIHNSRKRLAMVAKNVLQNQPHEIKEIMNEWKKGVQRINSEKRNANNELIAKEIRLKNALINNSHGNQNTAEMINKIKQTVRLQRNRNTANNKAKRSALRNTIKAKIGKLNEYSRSVAKQSEYAAVPGFSSLLP